LVGGTGRQLGNNGEKKAPVKKKKKQKSAPGDWKPRALVAMVLPGQWELVKRRKKKQCSKRGSALGPLKGSNRPKETTGHK